MILGIPSAAHREALLRTTAGGGRVPVMWSPTEADPNLEWSTSQYYQRDWTPDPSSSAAIILRDPADPEAGAMGLARLAWVAVGARWEVSAERGFAIREVQLIGRGNNAGGVWRRDKLYTLRDATHPAHAIGLTCVHLGLLDRVEVTGG